MTLTDQEFKYLKKGCATQFSRLHDFYRERLFNYLYLKTDKNREIAEYLYISVKTVEKHRANLMGKLDLHSASELTAFAIEKGLVSGRK